MSNVSAQSLLATQLLFLGPLTLGALLVAWFEGTFSRSRAFARYAALVLVSWVGSGLVLYVVMSAVTPTDGLRHLPTLIGAYAAPFLVIASVLPSLGKRWSRDGKVLFALSVCASASFFSPLLLLFAACTIQANCL